MSFVRFPVPSVVLRDLCEEVGAAPTVEEVRWGPTLFDLALGVEGSGRRIVHLGDHPHVRRWLPWLAPLVRLGAHQGQLWWRPHPPGILLAFDLLFWPRRPRTF